MKELHAVLARTVNHINGFFQQESKDRTSAAALRLDWACEVEVLNRLRRERNECISDLDCARNRINTASKWIESCVDDPNCTPRDRASAEEKMVYATGTGEHDKAHSRWKEAEAKWESKHRQVEAMQQKMDALADRSAGDEAERALLGVLTSFNLVVERRRTKDSTTSC